MTTRRGFLAGILAAGFAPAAIGSGVLMPVRKIALPEYSYARINELVTQMMGDVPTLPPLLNEVMLEWSWSGREIQIRNVWPYKLAPS